jgi:hypothetical protein
MPSLEIAGLITTLDLPGRSHVDCRVPKKLLLENAAPTAADKHYINDGIEELWWVAALKPTTIGVPEYRDVVREYVEIAVLSLTLRPGAKADRLTELVHRAVPYPVFLVTEQVSRLHVSLAHKRWSQGETGKTVLDGDVIAVDWDGGLDARVLHAFQNALALANQPKSTLYALCQGWIDTLLALHAARMTGVFTQPTSAQHAAARREALRECAGLGTQIAALRTAPAKETQIARQVEINLELKRMQAALAAARAKL